jgi:Endo-beta-mannanase
MKQVYCIFLFMPLLMFSCDNKDVKGSYIRVSEKNSRYFEYSSGEPFIPVGPNICWERFETDEEKILALYEQRFRILSENGGNYTRIWLSAPFFEVEHEEAYKYDEKIIQRISRLLGSADKYGIKVKFCFENFRKLTGSPAPFSTSVPFDKPIYSTENGGPLESMDDYFSSPEGKKLFLSKAQFIASHFADHQAVFGWELWNEINAVSVSDKKIIYDWTKEMLPIVKSLFPNHLVMQSLGSYDNENAREMYASYMKMPANEVAQVHRYLDPGAKWDICQSSMDTLAYNAVVELLEMTPSKPVVLSEVGAVEANHSGPGKYYESDTLGIILHDLLFAPFFAGAAGAGQSWHWQYYIEKNNLWWHFERFWNVTISLNPIEEQYTPFLFTNDDVRYYGLKGKTNIIIWCRDVRCNWETELENKIAPEQRVTNLSMAKLPVKDYSGIYLYDPWDNAMKEVFINEGFIPLRFTRSMVIRINL